MAALTAARAGLRVILADEGFRLGGSLLSERLSIGGVAADAFAHATLEELQTFENVTLMPRTTVFGWYDDNVFGALEKVQKHVAMPSSELPVERLWRDQPAFRLTLALVNTATLGALLFASILQLAGRTYNPFIYFRF